MIEVQQVSYELGKKKLVHNVSFNLQHGDHGPELSW